MIRIAVLAVLGAVAGFSLGPALFDEGADNALWLYVLSAVIGAVALPAIDAAVRTSRGRS